MYERIGIIGAGVAGLVVAKTLTEHGFDCELFDKNANLGGVWESGYHSLHLQLPKELYEFIDWPMPSSYQKYPSKDQILSYLESYAGHFKIRDLINFNCEVVEIVEEKTKKRWNLTYLVGQSSVASAEKKTKYFDFIVVCTGVYSNPYVPVFRGESSFKGKLIHTSTFRDPKLATGKNVVVVGFGKSALDVATEVSKYAASVSIVFRKAHWPLPRKFLGITDSKHILLTRFCASMLEQYYNSGKLTYYIHKYGKWFIWLYWRLIETLIRIQFQLGKCRMLPETPIEIDLFTGEFIAPPGFYSLVKRGVIKGYKSNITEFTESEIKLETGENLEADLVLLGTGWDQKLNFLPEENKDLISDDGLFLYRHMIHPNITNVAFIGLASTFSNSLSDHIESLWLLSYLSGDLSIPDKGTILKDISAMKKWKRKFIPEQRSRGSLIMLHLIYYHDELLRDLKIEHHRKGNMFSEVFSSYGPKDYQDLQGPSE